MIQLPSGRPRLLLKSLSPPSSMTSWHLAFKRTSKLKPEHPSLPFLSPFFPALLPSQALPSSPSSFTVEKGSHSVALNL